VIPLQILLADIRDIRPGLFAGWLWLFWIWVAMPEVIPSPSDGKIFHQIYLLGDRIGVGGCLIVGSLAAYGLGSLAYDGEKILVARLLRRSGRTEQVLKIVLANSHSTTFGNLLSVTTEHGQIQLSRANTANRLPRIEGKAWDLIRTATADAGQSLKSAIQRLSSLTVTLASYGHDYLLIYVDDLDSKIVLPIMPDPKRLLEDRALMRNRLADSVVETSVRVERLYSEADLRLAVALPLGAIGVSVALAMTAQLVLATCLFIATLLLVGGITLQGRFLQRDADAQLIDAVRTRRTSVQLATLTPIFARYNERAREACHQLAQLQLP